MADTTITKRVVTAFQADGLTKRIVTAFQSGGLTKRVVTGFQTGGLTKRIVIGSTTSTSGDAWGGAWGKTWGLTWGGSAIAVLTENTTKRVVTAFQADGLTKRIPTDETVS